MKKYILITGAAIFAVGTAFCLGFLILGMSGSPDNNEPDDRMVAFWEWDYGIERGRPGICISFDDHFVESWFNHLMPLSEKYGAVFTFFVSEPDRLTGAEIEMLKTMREAGHEIGCHTWRHSNMFNVTFEDYLREEIQPWLDFMADKGFDEIISFAHPQGGSYYEIERGLTSGGYFQALRSTQGYPAFYNWARDPIAENHIPVMAYSIDRKYDRQASEMIELLNQAKNEGSVLMLYTHEVKHIENEGHASDYVDYTVCPEMLEFVVKNAAELGLSFYRIRDLQRRPTQ